MMTASTIYTHTYVCNNQRTTLGKSAIINIVAKEVGLAAGYAPYYYGSG